MKLKKKNCIIAGLILLIILFELINPLKIISSLSIRKLNYSKKSAYKIIEYNLKDEVLDNEYSLFIDKSVLNKDFIIDNYDIYKDIVYLDNNHDLFIINALIDKGYNSKEINCILKTGDNDSINNLLKLDKQDKIVEFLSFDYANLANLDRYITYQKKNLTNYDETILYVELNLDKEYYKDALIVKDFSYSIFINKYNGLDKDFVPNDLEKVLDDYSYGTNYGNKEMLSNFYKMADDLNQELDLNIYIRSGYRDYDSQDKLYQEYLKLYGKNYVLKYVAYPGFSEHQTGLSVDIKASSSETFDNTKESSWLKNNAYKYGFIKRYPKDKINITGYQYEAWHYRYVGVEVSKYLYENNITFDEYYVQFLKNK